MSRNKIAFILCLMYPSSFFINHFVTIFLTCKYDIVRHRLGFKSSNRCAFEFWVDLTRRSRWAGGSKGEGEARPRRKEKTPGVLCAKVLDVPPARRVHPVEHDSWGASQASRKEEVEEEVGKKTKTKEKPPENSKQRYVQI